MTMKVFALAELAECSIVETKGTYMKRNKYDGPSENMR